MGEHTIHADQIAGVVRVELSPAAHADLAEAFGETPPSVVEFDLLTLIDVALAAAGDVETPTLRLCRHADSADVVVAVGLTFCGRCADAEGAGR